MSIIQEDGKYYIKDNYTGFKYGPYEDFDEASEQLKELKENMKID